MYWVIGIVILIVIAEIGYVLFPDLSKDNYDHQEQIDKFGPILVAINDAAFNGGGSIATQGKRSFTLFKNEENQKINFQYVKGHLTITWHYIYFRKEIVLKKQIFDVGNLSFSKQQKIADRLIMEMTQVVDNHKNNTGGAF